MKWNNSVEMDVTPRICMQQLLCSLQGLLQLFLWIKLGEEILFQLALLACPIIARWFLVWFQAVGLLLSFFPHLCTSG